MLKLSQISSGRLLCPTMAPRLFSCTAVFFSQAYLYASSILKTSSHWHGFCSFKWPYSLVSNSTPSYNCLSANSCFFWKTFSFMFYFILMVCVCTYVYMSAGAHRSPSVESSWDWSYVSCKLQAKLRSSLRAASAFNCSISAAPRD